MSNQESLLRKRIVEYYEQNDVSYQNWGDSQRPYQIHYGYKDSPTQGHYDSLMRMNEVLAEAANVQAGNLVLDAGCGVGGGVIWLAETIEAKVHGISISEYQIAKAKSFTSGNLHPIEFSVQDFTRMAFPSKTFDVVWGLESVCYAECKQDFLLEAYRVLRPDGYLVVADFFLNCSELDEIQSHSLEIWLDGWAIPNLCTQAEFLKYLDVIGYKNVRMRDVTSNIRYSSEEIYLRGKEGYPDDILTKNKGVVQIKHVQACLFQKVALELGVWSYRIFTGQK